MQNSKNIDVTFNKKHKPNLNNPSDRYGIVDFNFTDSQKNFFEVINQNIITFCEGLAGTGKTSAAIAASIPFYKELQSNRIVIIRTPMEATIHDKIGFLPDSLEAKTEPHFASAKNILSQMINPMKVESDLKSAHKKIEFMIPNFALGMTLDNSFIIIDEAQTLNPVIMKLLLERIGKNSKVVVLGDPSQVYSSTLDRQGMRDAIHKFFKVDGKEVKEPYYKNIGYFKFEATDCVRSDIVRTVLQAYSEDR